MEETEVHCDCVAITDQHDRPPTVIKTAGGRSRPAVLRRKKDLDPARRRLFCSLHLPATGIPHPANSSKRSTYELHTRKEKRTLIDKLRRKR